MSFIEARLTNQSVPKAREVKVAAGQAFEVGALGSLNANQEFVEASADPAVGAVTHVAQTPYGVNSSGFGAIAGRREFPQGKAIVTEAKATTWRCEYVGSLPAAPGSSYGLIRSTDGKWRINFADTSAPLQVKYLRPSNEFAAGVKQLVEVEFV